MTTSNARVREYWNSHIHDLEVSRHPPGSPEFFADLDAYHFEKLHHLLRLIDFEAHRGRDVLDVGCGAGVEVVRWARGGARVTGVDIAESAATLTRGNLAQQDLHACVAVADGEALPFPDSSFDFVYAHGVVQYTTDDRRLVDECYRVLRPGGMAAILEFTTPPNARTPPLTRPPRPRRPRSPPPPSEIIHTQDRRLKVPQRSGHPRLRGYPSLCVLAGKPC